jgi:hypothetical protein
MKYFSIPALLLISLFFASCDQDEDDLPNRLVGTWETYYFIDSVDYWVVNSLEFKNDSVYQFRTTVRESEKGPDLGYRLVYDDRYEWDGIMFTYSPDLAYWIDLRSEKFYAPKEELSAGIIDIFSQITARISFVQNKTKMIFQDVCSENSLGCSIEILTTEYVRVK